VTLQPLRALREFQQRVADAFHTLNLNTRRIIALLVALTIVGGMILVMVVGSSEFSHAREAVRTQERKTAILVDIVPQGRYDEDYIIIAGGRQQKLDYGWFLPDDTLGSWVEYVVDPADPSHLIAVGTPEDWKNRPWVNFLLPVGGLLGALFFAAIAADMIIPEDTYTAVERITRKRRRKPVPRRRRSGGRH
jgi:hypothetical protein